MQLIKEVRTPAYGVLLFCPAIRKLKPASARSHLTLLWVAIASRLEKEPSEESSQHSYDLSDTTDFAQNFRFKTLQLHVL